jgi:heme/copper-type cytochrome/quinol oxidase subunit 2
MSKKKAEAGCGGGLFVTLFLIFMILKLCGVIEWSWWWVSAPLWIPLVIVFCCLAVVAVVVVILIIADAKYTSRRLRRIKEQREYDRQMHLDDSYDN